MNFIFSCSTRYLTSERSERLRYRVEHSKIKFISTHGHVISSMFFICIAWWSSVFPLFCNMALIYYFDLFYRCQSFPEEKALAMLSTSPKNSSYIPLNRQVYSFCFFFLSQLSTSSHEPGWQGLPGWWDLTSLLFPSQKFWCGHMRRETSQDLGFYLDMRMKIFFSLATKGKLFSRNRVGKMA